MDSESQKRSASSSSSSSFSSCASEDRRVETEEIEAAETLADLAQLAMLETDSAGKWCSNEAKRDTRRFTRESPTPDSDLSHSPPAPGAVTGQHQDEKISTTTSAETERIQKDDCSRHMKGEQDADLSKTTSYSLVRGSKSRRNLTEEEKEERRIRRVLANRESARQTIRRRQALCEELTRKATTLVLENENLKKEKELALKEYQSLETTNKHLKAQIAKSIYTEVEKTPNEQESSVAEVTPLSRNSPWFLYNHFPVSQLFWPSILQSSNPIQLQHTTTTSVLPQTSWGGPVQLQHTPFNSIVIPSNVYVPCSSESESFHKQNNLTNDNRTQHPLCLFPCPWLFPLPEFGNGNSPASSGPKDKHDELLLGKQCSSSSSLNTVANMDYQAVQPIKLKPEVSGWTEARPNNPRFPLNGGKQKIGCHIIDSFHGPTLVCNGHASAVEQDHKLQLHFSPNTEVSSPASHIEISSLEKKQEQFICPGKNLVDAVAAAEARKRRKELTKIKSIHNRQSRLHC
ncbi:uncharacterized protein LOC133286807 isoform X2 [Gastrolobium bilobum]|uniref:uncharacterized protein LOC133286807 isoform X2 n=1 Tax=Gastrolobium bilobum TaxID=150636 RepID=UPI002AB30212|nr:uncharacterized protein LOC133286807 isoform X2 [Gastrolobium bilobum]